MRKALSLVVGCSMPMLLTIANADPLTINQNAWLNYAVVVNTQGKTSNLHLGQTGTVNGISSAQISGTNNAYMTTDQIGEWNASQLYQSGWITVAGVLQQGGDGWPGHMNHPTVYKGYQTDEGYLSYFMTGGFSFVSLTDPAHTWLSRFGRGR